MALDARESKAVEEAELLEEELLQRSKELAALSAVAEALGLWLERKCVEEELRQSEDRYRRRG